ncbi:MAG TPA: hypothetical protein VKW04_10685 [Planctomycetota bacterium]|nr:hypothetical protein [Planctomycetota bacterium]
MSESRASFKTVVLLAPLLGAVLALHAWGDGAADRIGRQVDLWQYPEISRPPFLLRLPRRVGDETLVSEVLTKFPDECVRSFGALLDLHPPAPGVQVILLGSDGASWRLAGEAGRPLEKNDSVYDPERRAILVRMEPAIEQSRVLDALRRGIARLLLYDAGSSRLMPWLREGLVGLLENSKAADAKASGEDLPALDLLLTAREASFRGLDGAPYARGSRLLAAWLLETHPTEFAAYCRASRLEGEVRLSRYIETFATNPVGEQAAWRDWLQRQK